MTTTYRYLFADLLTNDILAELPLTGVSFTQQLNQAGALQGHLLLSGMATAQFNVITGESGSGKSTLAFDILFNEGQRRYLERLN